MLSSELKWLGYYLVREGVLEPEQVREVAGSLQGEADFVDFAQAVVDSGLTEDYEMIQNLVDQAFAAGQEGGDPPVDIFIKPAGAPVTADETPTRPPLRLRMTSSSVDAPRQAVSPAEEEDEAPMPKRRPTAGPLGLKREEKSSVRSQLKALALEAEGEQAESEVEIEPPSPVRPRLQAKAAAPESTPEPEAEAVDTSSSGTPIRLATAEIRRFAGQPIPSANSAKGKSPAEAGQILARLLIGVRERGASDLHLCGGARPFARVNLNNEYLEDEVVEPEAAEALNLALLSPEQRQEFESEMDLDYLLSLDSRNRFRVNLMRHRSGIAASYRLVPNEIRGLKELGFRNPAIIEKLLDHHNGIILVTGPVSSGKTTTLAALVDLLNRKRYDHVICVEDPIEIVQRSASCNVTQREVGRHTRSFATALKGALREDPDIIVIGEMRDLETIEMAITAAETGHLVIGTLHTSDAATTLNRILDVFPPSQQAQIRSMTAESLRGIICQKLIPSTDGGVTIAEELLIGTVAVSNIIREGKMYQLKAVLQTGSKLGMCTMDQAIFNHYSEGRVSTEVALAHIKDSELVRRIKGMEDQISASADKRSLDGDDAKRKKGWFR